MRKNSRPVSFSEPVRTNPARGAARIEICVSILAKQVVCRTYRDKPKVTGFQYIPWPARKPAILT